MKSLEEVIKYKLKFSNDLGDPFYLIHSLERNDCDFLN